MDILRELSKSRDLNQKILRELEEKYKQDGRCDRPLLSRIFREICKENVNRKKSREEKVINVYQDIGESTYKRLHAGKYNGVDYPSERLPLEIVLRICIGMANEEQAFEFWFASGYQGDIWLDPKKKEFCEKMFFKYCNMNKKTEEKIKLASKEFVCNSYYPIKKLNRDKK